MSPPTPDASAVEDLAFSTVSPAFTHPRDLAGSVNLQGRFQLSQNGNRRGFAAAADVASPSLFVCEGIYSSAALSPIYSSPFLQMRAPGMLSLTPRQLRRSRCRRFALGEQCRLIGATYAPSKSRPLESRSRHRDRPCIWRRIDRRERWKQRGFHSRVILPCLENLLWSSSRSSWRQCPGHARFAHASKRFGWGALEVRVRWCIDQKRHDSSAFSLLYSLLPTTTMNERRLQALRAHYKQSSEEARCTWRPNAAPSSQAGVRCLRSPQPRAQIGA